MAGAGELNDSDYSYGPRPRHVRPDFIERSSLRDIPPPDRDTTFSRYSTNYDGGPAFFFGCARRKTSDRQLHTYVVRGPRVRRVLSCEARLALQGVTRIPRRCRNRSYPPAFLVVATDSLLRRFCRGFCCEKSSCLSQYGPLRC